MRQPPTAVKDGVVLAGMKKLNVIIHPQRISYKDCAKSGRQLTKQLCFFGFGLRSEAHSSFCLRANNNLLASLYSNGHNQFQSLCMAW